MEINEQALLAILAEHLEVTEKLLEHSIKLTQMVQQQADSLIFEERPTLEELRASILVLHKRVHAILDRK
jgi:hypothetical protein